MKHSFIKVLIVYLKIVEILSYLRHLEIVKSSSSWPNFFLCENKRTILKIQTSH